MSKKKIEKALKDKGWIPTDIKYEPVSYGRDGREGGWYITIDEESCNDIVAREIEKLEKEIFKDGEFQGCAILGYNTKAVLSIIEKMPVFLPIITPEDFVEGWLDGSIIFKYNENAFYDKKNELVATALQVHEMLIQNPELRHRLKLEKEADIRLRADSQQEKCPFETFVIGYFGLPETVKEDNKIAIDFGQLVCMLAMFNDKTVEHYQELLAIASEQVPKHAFPSKLPDCHNCGYPSLVNGR